MIDYNAWLEYNHLDLADAKTKAVRAWLHINEKPTTIVVLRGLVFLAVQTVRIEYLSGASGSRARDSEVRTTFENDVVVFGIRNHPKEADTDLREGDRFVVNKREIEITGIVLTDGELQAYGRYIT